MGKAETEFEAGYELPPVAGKFGGRLPVGVDVCEYLSIPSNTQGRSAEANYAKEYARRVAAAKLDLTDAEGIPTCLDTPIGSVTVASGANMAERQVKLFGKLDSFDFDDSCLFSPTASGSKSGTSPADTWSNLFEGATQSLRTSVESWPKHHTVVFDAIALL